jgi:sulfate/thiosulfate-binding protein
MYKQLNDAFAKRYKAESGQAVTIKLSHGGSSKQARSVIDGLEADVVTLGTAIDIDALHEHGNLVAADWRSRLPHDATPYTSTIVFVVRKGNPKQIKDWSDLVKPGIGIVTPNPKTSAGGKWVYLAAYGWQWEHANHDDAAAKQFVGQFYHNTVVLDSGARGATTSFAKRNLGDVLPAWENEAYLTLAEFGSDAFEIVYPPQSILAEPPVAIVDKVVDKHGTRQVAEAYLKFLYSEEAQEIEAKNHYRPRLPAVVAKHASEFPNVKLFSITEVFGSWQDAQKKHFDDGAVFDQIYQPK